MRLNPHVAFNGQCQEAFGFYKRCLGAEILTMLAYADSPMAEQVPAEWRSKILHATLTIDGNIVLYGADAIPGQYELPRGFHLALGIKEPAQAERIFRELAENGTVEMPLEKTFWAVLFGMVTDRFGVRGKLTASAASVLALRRSAPGLRWSAP